MQSVIERDKFLGIDKDGCVVFANYGIYKYGNDDERFHASFDRVYPIREVDYDYEDEIRENYSEDNVGPDFLYELCKRYDCAPDEIPERLKEDYIANGYGDIRDTHDCSLFPYEVEVNGDVWFFESGSCGQCEPFTDLNAVIPAENQALIKDLVDHWHKNHLKKVDYSPGSPSWDIIQRLEELNDQNDVLDDGNRDVMTNHIRNHAYVNGEYRGYDPERNVQPPSLKETCEQAKQASVVLNQQISDQMTKLKEAR